MVVKDRDLIISLSIQPGEQTLRALAKRAHDVTGGLRTLRFAVESLREGYRFDDAKAKAKIEAMEKAITNLENECKILVDILSAAFQGATSGSDPQG